MTPQMTIRIAAKNEASGTFEQVINDARRAGAQIGNSMAGARVQTANLAAQFNDIGVMLAAGQSPLLLALQQGTQVAQALGTTGGAAGAARALGGALLSVLSPVNLLTIGTIGLGAAAVQWLMGLRHEAPSAEAALKAHSEWLQRILQGYEAAEQAARKTAQSANRLPAGVVLSDLQASLTEQEGAARQFETRIARIRNGLADVHATMKMMADISRSSGAPDAQIEATMRGVEAMQQLGLNSGMTAGQINELMVKMRQLFNTTDNPMLKQLASDAYDVALALRQTAGAAQQTAAAIAVLNNGSTLDAVTRATGRASSAIDKIKGLAPELRSPAQQAKDALNAALADSPDAIMRQLALGQYNDTMSAIRTAEQRQQGAASVSEAKRQAAAYQSVITALRDETAAMGLTSREAEKLNRIRAAGVDAGSAEAETIRSAVDLLYNQKDALAAVESEHKRIQAQVDLVAGSFQNMGTAFRDAFAKGGNVAGNVLDMLLGKAGDLGTRMFDAGLNSLVNMGAQALLGGLTGGGGGLFGAVGKARLFAAGGFTGAGPNGSPAGIVHANEFVVNPSATQRYRAMLEAMNSGGLPGGESGPETVITGPATARTARAEAAPVVFNITAVRQGAEDFAQIAREQFEAMFGPRLRQYQQRGY